MSPVPPFRHRVPMLANGPGAPHFAELMTPFGMNIEVISGEIGSAAAIKMLRSVIVKGFEAICLEALIAAHKAGVVERVLRSLDASYGDTTIRGLSEYLLGRHIRHTERRAHELDEAAETLSEMGIAPLATAGGVQRLYWSAQQLKNLSQDFQNESIADILNLYGDVGV